MKANNGDPKQIGEMNSSKNDSAGQQQKKLEIELGCGELEDLTIKDAKKDKKKEEEKGRGMDPRMN